jgi:hypothetical protein
LGRKSEKKGFILIRFARRISYRIYSKSII